MCAKVLDTLTLLETRFIVSYPVRGSLANSSLFIDLAYSGPKISAQ